MTVPGQGEQKAGGDERRAMRDYLLARKWVQRPDGKWTHAGIKNAYTGPDAKRMQETVDQLVRGSSHAV